MSNNNLVNRVDRITALVDELLLSSGDTFREMAKEIIDTMETIYYDDDCQQSDRPIEHEDSTKYESTDEIIRQIWQELYALKEVMNRD